MEFRILGPLEIVGDDGAIEVRPAKQRSLLAILLLHANEVVSADALIEALWDDRRPASAEKLLQVYVSQLRRALGADGRISTRAPGYSIATEPDQLDSARFEVLLANGRVALAEGNAARARRELRQALALWRGPALADFAYSNFARADADRLEELRFAALEERIEADLALEAGEPVIADLRAFVEAQPLRERPRRQLMLALYRSGRQVEALDVYQEARRTLRDELGLDPGHELQQMQAAVLRHDPALAVPARPARSRPGLPAALSPLLGREWELDELGRLLRQTDARLITLIGAGGSGKTRLALEVARSLVDDFANGVVFVELAALRDAGHVPGTIAAAMGIEPRPDESPLDALERGLRPDESLLVLDNAEHLAGVGSLVVALLRASPGLKVLVTSRSVLHVSGERLYPVAPLARGPAVELFLARARAAAPGFDPSANELAMLVEICDRLDCLPLAIELAAPRVRTLSVEGLLKRLAVRLTLLTGGPRDLPARQRTLAETLAWSTDLLGEEDRTALGRLSVFVGGCSLEAVEAVCGASLENVESLVDSSLVDRTTTAAGDVRLTMLETIREHAAVLLDRTGDRSMVEAAHVAYYARLAERAVLKGPAAPTWLALIDLELENLRTAWAHGEAAGDHDSALRIAAALYRFWYLRGYFREGRDRIRLPLRRWTGDPGLHARALHGLAGLSWLLGEVDEANEEALRGITLGLEAGALEWVMGCHTVVAMVARDRGDLAMATEHIEESASLAERLGLDEDVMVANTNLGSLALVAGDLELARGRWERSLALNEGARFGDVDDFALLGLGEVAYRQGRLIDAEAFFGRALRIAQSTGRRHNAALALSGQAAVAAERGDHVEAARLLGRVSALVTTIGGALTGPDAYLYREANDSVLAHLGPERFAALVSVAPDVEPTRRGG